MQPLSCLPRQENCALGMAANPDILWLADGRPRITSLHARVRFLSRAKRRVKRHCNIWGFGTDGHATARYVPLIRRFSNKSPVTIKSDPRYVKHQRYVRQLLKHVPLIRRFSNKSPVTIKSDPRYVFQKRGYAQPRSQMSLRSVLMRRS